MECPPYEQNAYEKAIKCAKSKRPKPAHLYQCLLPDIWSAFQDAFCSPSGQRVLHVSSDAKYKERIASTFFDGFKMHTRRGSRNLVMLRRGQMSKKTQSSHEWQSFLDHKRNVKGYCSFILAEQQTVERFFETINGVFGTNNNFPLGPERGQFQNHGMKRANEFGSSN